LIDRSLFVRSPEIPGRLARPGLFRRYRPVELPRPGAATSGRTGTGPFMPPQMIAKMGEKPQLRRDIFRFGKFLPSFELSRLP
jgi:hypothetical protein